MPSRRSLLASSVQLMCTFAHARRAPKRTVALAKLVSRQRPKRFSSESESLKIGVAHRDNVAASIPCNVAHPLLSPLFSRICPEVEWAAIVLPPPTVTSTATRIEVDQHMSCVFPPDSAFFVDFRTVPCSRSMIRRVATGHACFDGSRMTAYTHHGTSLAMHSIGRVFQLEVATCHRI